MRFTPFLFRCRLPATLIVLAGAAFATAAQNKALDLAQDANIKVPQGMRDDLATIGRYADTVNRRVNSAATALAGDATSVGSAPASGQAAPPEVAGGRRFDTLVDPFEVSPQLRENRRGSGGFRGLPAASKLDIRRRVQVRAMLVTPHGRAAQLEVDARRVGTEARGKGAAGASDGDVLTVMDGELVDFGELGTYVVHVSAREGVTLANPGNPQTGRITLR